MKSGRQAESAAFLPYRIRVSKALAAELEERMPNMKLILLFSIKIYIKNCIKCQFTKYYRQFIIRIQYEIDNI